MGIIDSRATSMGTVQHQNQHIQYYVLPGSFEPRLPGFLGRHEEMFFISEDVPEKWRPTQIIHEFVEMTQLKGVKGRCVEATKVELAIVANQTPEELQEYIQMRIGFFQRLIQFYKNQTPIDKEAIQEFEGSLLYLEAL